MRRLVILSLLLIFFYSNSYSQLQVAHDAVTGRPYMMRNVDNLQGTPYLFEDWKAGTVRLKNGSVAKNIRLKYDIYNNKLFYNQNDSLFEFIDEVDEFRLVNPKSADKGEELIFANIPSGKKDKNLFAQVLAKGKVSIVKFHTKEIQEVADYGSTTKIRTLLNKSSNYFVTNNDMRSAKYSSDQLEELVADKKSEVLAFVNSNHLNLKKEQDFITAINFYNSLFAK